MKRIIAALCMSVLASCAFSNQYGECIGLVSKGDPELEYRLSMRNAVWTAVSPWTIVSPVIWFVSCARCPVGYKQHPKAAPPVSSRYRLVYNAENF